MLGEGNSGAIEAQGASGIDARFLLQLTSDISKRVAYSPSTLAIDAHSGRELPVLQLLESFVQAIPENQKLRVRQTEFDDVFTGPS